MSDLIRTPLCPIPNPPGKQRTDLDSILEIAERSLTKAGKHQQSMDSADDVVLCTPSSSYIYCQAFCISELLSCSAPFINLALLPRCHMFRLSSAHFHTRWCFQFKLSHFRSTDGPVPDLRHTRVTTILIYGRRISCNATRYFMMKFLIA